MLFMLTTLIVFDPVQEITLPAHIAITVSLPPTSSSIALNPASSVFDDASSLGIIHSSL